MTQPIGTASPSIRGLGDGFQFNCVTTHPCACRNHERLSDSAISIFMVHSIANKVGERGIDR